MSSKVDSGVVKSKSFRMDEANSKILRLLDVCEEYLESQQQLEKHLKSGFLQMTLARKQVPRLCADDCRADIDPAIHISQQAHVRLPEAVCSSAAEPVEEVVSEATVDKDGLRDSLFAFSGLPPTALQAAQKQFLEATLVAVKASNLAGQMRVLLDGALDDNVL